MKKHIRIIAFVLVLLMVAGMLAGCKKDEKPTDTTTTPAPTTTTTGNGGGGTTTATPPDTTTEYVPPDVSGYEFRFGSGGGPLPPPNPANMMQEKWLDEIQALEDELDISFVGVDAGDVKQTVLAAGMAGTLLADMLHGDTKDTWALAVAGVLLPVDGDTMMNAGMNSYDDTRWWQPLTEGSRLFDEYRWGVQVASEYYPPETGYFLAFNPVIVKATGVEGANDLYGLVRSKKWTWEKYTEIAKAACFDEDGDGIYDIWGSGTTALGNEMNTNGVEWIAKDAASGKWTFAMNSPNGIAMLEIFKEINNYNYQTQTEGKVVNDGRIWFQNGNAAFCGCDMQRAGGRVIAEAVMSAGIVPLPLGPNATEYRATNQWSRTYCFQNSNPDLEKTVYIANRWADIMTNDSWQQSLWDKTICRTDDDFDMVVNYIVPYFKVNTAVMHPDMWPMIDDVTTGSFLSQGGVLQEILYGTSISTVMETTATEFNKLIDEWWETYTSKISFSGR